MTMKRVIGIGETVLDILFKDDQPMKAVPGGSTFNSIVSLGRAGVPCAMVTEVGGDHVGDIICNFLVNNAVECRATRNRLLHLVVLEQNIQHRLTYTYYTFFGHIIHTVIFSSGCKGTKKAIARKMRVLTGLGKIKHLLLTPLSILFAYIILISYLCRSKQKEQLIKNRYDATQYCTRRISKETLC